MLKKHWIFLGVFLLASVAFAEGKSAKSVDVLGGFALNKGGSSLRAGIGNPGLETMFLYGVASKFNIGGLLALNWGEGVDFAVRFQAPLRFAFYDSGKLGIAAGFTPGIAILAGPGTAVTIPLHFDLTTGFRVTNELSLSAGFEIPLEIWTKGSFGVIIPLAAAIGAEYHVASSLKIWSRIRSGYAFTAGGGESKHSGDYHGGGISGVFGATSCHVGVALAF